jgi:hypothetical protein
MLLHPYPERDGLGDVMASEKTYDITRLTDEEASMIVCALYREIHLIKNEKHYKATVLRSIIDKIGEVKYGPRKPRGME